MRLVTGLVQVHPRGFGFVTPEHAVDGVDGDLYNRRRQPEPGDARRPRRGAGREAGARRTAARGASCASWSARPSASPAATTSMIPAWRTSVPFDRRLVMDVHVPRTETASAAPGEMVEVEITRWPTPTRNPVGSVTAVLGDIDAPGVDARLIVRKHQLPDEHGPAALAEAQRAGTRGPAARQAGAARLPPLAHGDHRRRVGAGFRRRRHDRAAAERQFPARRAHRRRRPLRAGGHRARRRGAPARHVRLFPRPGHPHAAGSAGGGTVQPQAGGRAARAVVPDGDRPPGRRAPLRAARRRDPQRRAHDVRGGQRHPHRRRPGRAQEVPAPGAAPGADGRAVRGAQRQAARPGLDRLRPSGSEVADGRRGPRGGDRGRGAQPGAPPDRGVHARGQRDGGPPPGAERHAGAVPRARGAGPREGRRSSRRSPRRSGSASARRPGRSRRGTSSSFCSACRDGPRHGRWRS